MRFDRSGNDEPREDDERDEVPSGDRWDTLAQAFAAHHYPMENLPLVQRLVDALGVDHYEGIRSRSYIKGVRRDGGRRLAIAYGYTGGLTSEQEILNTVGDVDRGSSADGRQWWMHHPWNKLRDGSGPGVGRSQERDYGQCPFCFLSLPASGVCDHCGE